jgi:tryptophan-rich sensory protein
MEIIKVLASILFCALAGIIGSIFTMPNIPTWYATLHKPFFSPPNWLFGPAWTTLYVLMGISFYFVIKKGISKIEVKDAAIYFIFQLLLNALWSFLFFGLKSPFVGVVCIVFLWLSIVATMIKFKKISEPAFWLLVPYILWVSFASVLNLAVWILNR